MNTEIGCCGACKGDHGKAKEQAPGGNVAARKMLYALIAISAAVIVFGVYRSFESGSAPQAQAAEAQKTGALVSMRPSLDLGTVSMAAGKVRFSYLIKNGGPESLTINRIYTSCMCTNATLVTTSERKGPFGMPGHHLPTTLKAALAAGETANLEVLFDPAAHGPSGLGRIERFVTVESAEAPPLELRMVVMVQP